MDLVRLACVKRAASVHPEPGSNSPTKICPTQPTTKMIDQAKAFSQKSATYRSEETSREGPRVRCVLAVLSTSTQKRINHDDRPVSVFDATRDGDTEIDWADPTTTRK
jgi:hypothetical protein